MLHWKQSVKRGNHGLFQNVYTDAGDVGAQDMAWVSIMEQDQQQNGPTEHLVTYDIWNTVLQQDLNSRIENTMVDRIIQEFLHDSADHSLVIDDILVDNIVQEFSHDAADHFLVMDDILVDGIVREFSHDSASQSVSISDQPSEVFSDDDLYVGAVDLSQVKSGERVEQSSEQDTLQEDLLYTSQALTGPVLVDNIMLESGRIIGMTFEPRKTAYEIVDWTFHPTEQAISAHPTEQAISAHPTEQAISAPVRGDIHEQQPRVMQVYRRFYNGTFVLIMLILIFSAAAYLFDGGNQRGMFGYRYYIEGYEHESDRNLMLVNTVVLEGLQVEDQVLIAVNRETDEHVVQRIMGFETVNGVKRYLTEDGLSIDGAMIMGTPVIRLPYRIHLFSTHFFVIVASSLLLLLLLHIADKILMVKFDSSPALPENMADTDKKSPKSLVGILFQGIFVVLLILLMGVALILLIGGGKRSVLGYYYFTVLTSSMQSEIPQYSLVIVKSVDPNTIEVGDDITYLKSSDQTVTHRVIAIIEDYYLGERGFQTQGIENELPDANIVVADNVLGVVVHHVAELGGTLLYMKQNVWFIAAMLMGLLLFSYFVKKAIAPTDKDENEEEDQQPQPEVDTKRRKRYLG